MGQKSSLKGQDGVDGTNGTDGKDGIDGTNGKDGSTWFSGITSPEEASLSPKLGDFYVNYSTWDVYQFDGNKWNELGGIKGDKGDKGDTGLTAYSNTILPSDNGMVVPNLGSGVIGQNVTFFLYPEEESSVQSLSVYTYDEDAETYNETVYETDPVDDTVLTKIGDSENYKVTLPMVENGYVVKGNFAEPYVAHSIEIANLSSFGSGLTYQFSSEDSGFENENSVYEGANVTLKLMLDETLSETVIDSINVSGQIIENSGNNEFTFVMPNKDVNIVINSHSKTYAFTHSEDKVKFTLESEKTEFVKGATVEFKAEPIDIEYYLSTENSTLFDGTTGIDISSITFDTETGEGSFVMPNNEVHLSMKASEKVEHQVNYTENEAYTVEITSDSPNQKLVEGANVTLTIESTDPSTYLVEGIKLTSGEEPVEYTNEGTTYSFVMPSGDVNLEVLTDMQEYSVTYEDVEGVTTDLKDTQNYKVGEKVEFAVAVDDKYEIDTVKYSYGETTLDATFTDGKYSFTMPNANVSVAITTKATTKPYIELSESEVNIKEGEKGLELVIDAYNYADPTSEVTIDASEIFGAVKFNNQGEDGGVSQSYTPTVTWSDVEGHKQAKLSYDAYRPTSGRIVVGGKTVEINVESDYSTYTEISTAAEFIDWVKNPITSAYLSANIDLGGVKFVKGDDANANSEGYITAQNFANVLDGRGYSISNFVVTSSVKTLENIGDQNSVAHGMFQTLTGVIKNVEISGTIDALGNCALIAATMEEAANGAYVENIKVNVVNDYTGAAESFTTGKCEGVNRNAGIVTHATQGTHIKNAVVLVDNQETEQKFAPFGNYAYVSTDTLLENAYTNYASGLVANHGSDGVKADYNYKNVYFGVDFTLKTGSLVENAEIGEKRSVEVDLPSKYWTLGEDQVPEFVLNGSISSIKTNSVYLTEGGQSDVIDLSTILNKESATSYVVTSTNEDALSASLNEEGKTISVVSGDVDNDTEVEVKVELVNEDKVLDEVTLNYKVFAKADSTDGTWTELTAENITNLTGEGNYYLNQDITVTSACNITGFKGTIEGNGHTITYQATDKNTILFNGDLTSGSAVFQNIKFDLTDSKSGQSLALFQNLGSPDGNTLKNIDVIYHLTESYEGDTLPILIAYAFTGSLDGVVLRYDVQKEGINGGDVPIVQGTALGEGSSKVAENYVVVNGELANEVTLNAGLADFFTLNPLFLK